VGRYKKLRLLYLLLSLFITSEAGSALIDDIYTDYREFYLNRDGLLMIGAGMGLSAVMANTFFDREVQEYYQDNLRSPGTDRVSEVAETPGAWQVTIPCLALTSIISEEGKIHEWSARSLRAILVGTPAVLALQRITGSSRPSEGDSKWHPFKDSDGVSGHAFIGSVPFITAGVLSEDIKSKGIFYTLSILPGLSRINDNKHYLSQVISGWYIGYLSVRAVNKTVSDKSFVILPYRDGFMALLTYRF